MNKWMFAGAFVMSASVAAAHVAAPSPDAHERMGEPQTRAEVTQRVQQMFNRLDTDKDGFITEADRTTFKGEARGRLAERRPGREDAGVVFDRIDANHDNMISRDEFAQAGAMRGGPGRHDAMLGRPGGEGRREHGGLLARADADKDGRVSLAEMQAAALQRFDRADLNHDGQITQDERQQMRQQWQQRRPAAPPPPPAPTK